MFICVDCLWVAVPAFNFEIIWVIFFTLNMFIYATKDNKNQTPQILSPRDNLLFYHDPRRETT